MLVFDSVQEGEQALREYAATNRRTVFALLAFQDSAKKVVKKCFLFKSEGNADSQLIKNYPDVLRINGVPSGEMDHALEARQVAIDAELQNPQGLGIQAEGHAEEFLIRHFEACCRRVGDIKNVTIYLSHSPCIPLDKNASHSLPAWPTSCTKKLAHLARHHPRYFFSICSHRQFGTLSGSDSIEAELKRISGNLPNLTFVDLSS